MLCVSAVTLQQIYLYREMSISRPTKTCNPQILLFFISHFAIVDYIIIDKFNIGRLHCAL